MTACYDACDATQPAAGEWRAGETTGVVVSSPLPASAAEKISWGAMTPKICPAAHSKLLRPIAPRECYFCAIYFELELRKTQLTQNAFSPCCRRSPEEHLQSFVQSVLISSNASYFSLRSSTSSFHCRPYPLRAHCSHPKCC